MARILLIDDDNALLDVLVVAFQAAGHHVERSLDGAAALAQLQRSPPDLVVSDINLPALDGFTLCRRLREAGSQVPILLLTARDTEIDEALGLDLGADDYLTKPFSTRVLLARVAALLRRRGWREAGPESTLSADGLELFLEQLQARFRGQPVPVTVTEFRLLEALIRRPGHVLSRDQLLDATRGDDSAAADRIIDTYVRRLRRKLEAIERDFDRIETVIGAGYRWRTAADPEDP
ncbi:MAG TPA: response regulator transcription factor [Myxococcaceae bacterium]|nr:response regulator transcription factor [Myxococcaceae bacterium]